MVEDKLLSVGGRDVILGVDTEIEKNELINKGKEYSKEDMTRYKGEMLREFMDENI